MDAPDPRLVRLASRHFNDMQGLRGVLFGLVTIPICGIYLSTRDTVSTAVAIVSGVAAVVAGMTVLDRYYARAFGRVSSELPRGWMYVAGAFGVVAVFDQQLPGAPSLAWLVWACPYAWIVWDCWPERKYHLLTLAAVLFISISHVQVPRAVTTESWFAQGFLLLSFVEIATGSADHRLLVRLFRQERLAEPARPESR